MKNFIKPENKKYICKEFSDKYLKRKKQFKYLCSIPLVIQKSDEWHDARKKSITGTSLAPSIAQDKFKNPCNIIYDKCGLSEKFESNENTHHGVKYEYIGTLFYSYHNNVQMEELGLINHPKYKYIAASPDGICSGKTLDNKKTKLVGRLLEIKFPKKRRIITEGELDGEICPHYYYVQIQAQLFVTVLDECDFLQCKISEYENYDEFIKDGNIISEKTGLEKGAIIQLLPFKKRKEELKGLYDAKYIYPPSIRMKNKEITEWIGKKLRDYNDEEYYFDKVIYWKLEKVTCHLVKYDKNFIEPKLKYLKKFWECIEYYREHKSKVIKLKSYTDEIGESNHKLIFSRIKKDTGIDLYDLLFN